MAISGSFSVPAIPPYPAPAGYHWEMSLVGNGFGGYRDQWLLIRDANFQDGTGPSTTGGGSGTNPAPTPPHLSFSFDTIGQIIPRTIGDCRLPLKLLWVQGINLPYDTLQTSEETPSGTAVLTFSAIPPWVGVGLEITGPVGIPDGTTVAAVTAETITMSANATDDIPIDTVITITTPPGAHQTSSDTFVLSGAAPTGSTSLTFGDLPDWLAVGAPVTGVTAIPGGTVVTSFDTTTIGLSQATIAPITAGTAITIGGGPRTMTFAAALCMPLDPLETGALVQLYDGADLIFDSEAGIVIPPDWEAVDQALLAISLAGVIYYPGTESQLPAPLIQNDRGVAVTNAFRGIRYIILPNYPIGRGLPRLNANFERDNDPKSKKKKNIIAVTFAGGSG